MDLDKWKCPQCKGQLDHIEVCNEDDEEIKDAFNCQNCNMIVYTHRFKNEHGSVVIPIFGDTDETGHPTKFNGEDLESLTISLVDTLMPDLEKQLPPVPQTYIREYNQEFKNLINFAVDKVLKDFFRSDLEETEGCLHDYEMQPGCGVQVCHKCGDHKGLARCYCGWNLAPGERLEDDVEY